MTVASQPHETLETFHGVNPATDTRVGRNEQLGKGKQNQETLREEDTKKRAGVPTSGDRAIQQFSAGSLRNTTNQSGTNGYKFQLEPHLGAVSSSFANPESLRTTKHPVQDFWVYDGAYPGLTDRGKVATSVDQILPNYRITEQDAIEWNRIGSKKGWMFNGVPIEKYGHHGENVPSHTDDGWPKSIKKHRWGPLPRSTENQGLATRDMPAIDIENNARGIGVTGEGSGNGGMAGGYQEVQPDRLRMLPIPSAKFNWTGTRVWGTARYDPGRGMGAGGFRAGWQSQYASQPVLPNRQTVGISRVTPIGGP